MAQHHRSLKRNDWSMQHGPKSVVSHSCLYAGSSTHILHDYLNPQNHRHCNWTWNINTSFAGSFSKEWHFMNLYGYHGNMMHIPSFQSLCFFIKNHQEDLVFFWVHRIGKVTWSPGGSLTFRGGFNVNDVLCVPLSTSLLVYLESTFIEYPWLFGGQPEYVRMWFSVPSRILNSSLHVFFPY